jgi:CelD/BcsL family acetyltransferase involved in cellulose biosynthesis
MVLLVQHGKHLLGAAPLMLSSRKFLGLDARMLSFIENDESPHCNFLIIDKYAHADAIRVLLKQITSFEKRWDILLFRKIPAESSVVDSIKACCDRQGYPVAVKKSLHSPVITTDVDWRSFYQQKSQRFKKRIRHSRNRIKRLGRITVQELCRPEAVISLLGEVFAVGTRSWKEKLGTAIGSSPQSRRFYSSLPNTIGPRGNVSLWCLRLNNQLIAFEYHLRDRDVVYGLRAEFDEAYRDCGPGSVLDFEVVRGLFENNTRIYNMCGNPYEHKLRWTAQVEAHVDILVFSRRPYGRFLAFLEKSMKPVAKQFLALCKKPFIAKA